EIVVQLLTNAADAVAASPMPRIEIRARRVDQGAEIVVTDNGVGIAPNVQPHVFDPFFTTKQAGQGPRLGGVTGLRPGSATGRRGERDQRAGLGGAGPDWAPEGSPERRGAHVRSPGAALLRASGVRPSREATGPPSPPAPRAPSARNTPRGRRRCGG